MGADIKALRVRIKSVDSTLHLTKAMGLVASSKIRRATDAMLKAREYAAATGEIVALLLTSPECGKSPFVKERGGARTAYVVVAGDRGLAGGYNANIFRAMAALTAERVYPIGKRACDRYGAGYPSAENFRYEDAVKLANELCAQYEAGAFDRLCIVSTNYESVMTQVAALTPVLPLRSEKKTDRTGVLFEPDEITVLNAAVPGYLAGMLWAAVRESFACEVAARRMAMDSAGKNAKQMIDGLQLQYNRARQSSITQEITEIVAGGDAQK